MEDSSKTVSKAAGEGKGGDIAEVAEWCCYCVGALADNANHRCQYDHEIARGHEPKRKCVSCGKKRYNVGQCKRTPEQYRPAARNLIAVSKEVSELNNRRSTLLQQAKQPEQTPEIISTIDAEVLKINRNLTDAVDRHRLASEAWKSIVETHFHRSTKQMAETQGNLESNPGENRFLRERHEDTAAHNQESARGQAVPLDQVVQSYQNGVHNQTTLYTQTASHNHISPHNQMGPSNQMAPSDHLQMAAPNLDQMAHHNQMGPRSQVAPPTRDGTQAQTSDPDRMHNPNQAGGQTARGNHDDVSGRSLSREAILANQRQALRQLVSTCREMAKLLPSATESLNQDLVEHFTDNIKDYAEIVYVANHMLKKAKQIGASIPPTGNEKQQVGPVRNGNGGRSASSGMANGEAGHAAMKDDCFGQVNDRAVNFNEQNNGYMSMGCGDPFDEVANHGAPVQASFGQGDLEQVTGIHNENGYSIQHQNQVYNTQAQFNQGQVAGMPDGLMQYPEALAQQTQHTQNTQHTHSHHRHDQGSQSLDGQVQYSQVQHAYAQHSHQQRAHQQQGQEYSDNTGTLQVAGDHMQNNQTQSEQIQRSDQVPGVQVCGPRAASDQMLVGPSTMHAGPEGFDFSQAGSPQAHRHMEVDALDGAIEEEHSDEDSLFGDGNLSGDEGMDEDEMMQDVMEDGTVEEGTMEESTIEEGAIEGTTQAGLTQASTTQTATGHNNTTQVATTQAGVPAQGTPVPFVGDPIDREQEWQEMLEASPELRDNVENGEVYRTTNGTLQCPWWARCWNEQDQWEFEFSGC